MTTTNATKTTAGKKVCPKCHGTGHLPEFARRDAGMCYPCNGRGYVGGKPRYTIYGELIVD